VARTCRHFGISRKTFYKRRGRFAEHGAAGLCDRPGRPHRSPRATPSEVIGKILYLRENYHFGAGRIADYLKRFHQISIATSSVHRILVRRGLGRLPANQKHRPHKQRWQRCEKPQLGHRLQVDVKFLERIHVLKIFDGCNQITAIQFIDEVLRRLPFRIMVIQTDNGAEFQSRFHWHLEDLDIQHAYIRPRTSDHIAWTTRSSTSCWTGTASPTTSTCSTPSCVSGRTTTITTARMERSTGKPRTSGCWRRRGPACHRLSYPTQG